MSTHNITDGTGGLDASIRFELDRSENVGVGMRRSLEDFIALLTLFASMADLIAMGVVLAYPSCGRGPFIPYRAGRIDAPAAGPSGVPEPQQDLQTHINKFAQQGFNQQEMIGLVACEHTLGGVRKEDFDVTGNETFGLFHGSQPYDNTVVTGYLDDTTPNPLVAGTNDTLKSDLRIFSSDGNATIMKILADKSAFDQTCTSFKTRLSVSNDAGNQLVLTTSLRLLNQSTNANRNVTLFYTSNQNGPDSQTFSVSSSSHGPIGSRGGNGFSLKGIPVEFWAFAANINSTTSISKSWFEIDENGGSGNKVVVDNGGDGFSIDQDVVLFDGNRTKRNSIPDAPASGENSLSFDIVVAVRIDKQSSLSRIYIDWFDSFHFDFVSTTGTVDLSLDTGIPPESGYVFYSGTIEKGSVATSLNVHAEFNDGRNVGGLKDEEQG
ncbi:heme peroxidase [Dendrothele bispora CBS 962.96]|uniref:Peroxidase n=1 Tax=Dendrothele bispora (strain CBS 962.96) TaxID=1314807 RepID=A0A4S8M771_DENBC|nr:heme peroxidase [Dendrothele bispora CBS 962.96]